MLVPRKLAILALFVMLSACVRIIPGGTPPLPAPPPVPTSSASPTPGSAALLGLSYGPSVASLGLTDADARGALAAFRLSCPKLLARTDTSGLTRNIDWKPACDAAAIWPSSGATRFFERWFETVRVGDGKALVTGYYEPEIAGVRSRQPGFDVPVYALL